MNCSVGDLPVPVESWEMEEGPGDKLERTRAQRDTIRQHIAQLIKDLDRELQPGS
jgi:hypothetical protein